MGIAGDCLSRPDSFRLQSDTVLWSMVIARGDECIQGLRGKTMLLETVSIVEQPKTGRIVLQGPSFSLFRRYRIWFGFVQVGYRGIVDANERNVNCQCGSADTLAELFVVSRKWQISWNDRRVTSDRLA
jgi:hypothetical protein